MYPIYAYGSEEQRQQWLPAMARGELIGCFGLTEAHGGSDPASMKTRAVRDGSDWRISGSKMWITSGPVADLAIVWAQTEDGIQGFVLEKGMAGFTTQEIKHKMSLRASLTGALFFDDVRVPDSHRLPNVKGLKGPLGCLTQARYGISWGRSVRRLPAWMKHLAMPRSACCSVARWPPRRARRSSWPRWPAGSPPRSCWRCSWAG